MVVHLWFDVPVAVARFVLNGGSIVVHQLLRFCSTFILFGSPQNDET